MGSRGQTPRTPGGAAEIRPVSAAEDPFQTPRVLTAGSRPSLSRDRENAPPSSRGGDGGQALRIHSPMEMAPNPEEVRGGLKFLGVLGDQVCAQVYDSFLLARGCLFYSV